jgi:signal transduction histidine kinase
LHPQFENLPICIDSPELIWGWFDPRTLERGLYNLLLNACEMVPHQVGHIDVNIQRLGSNVEIRVSDNGPGIPECIREKLFQPFVSHGKQHGSGLGLAIVQKACFDHNGTVVLENSSPEGTTFRIVLPLACRLSTVPREEEVSGIEVVYGAPHGY